MHWTRRQSEAGARQERKDDCSDDDDNNDGSDPDDPPGSAAAAAAGRSILNEISSVYVVVDAGARFLLKQVGIFVGANLSMYRNFRTPACL